MLVHDKSSGKNVKADLVAEEINLFRVFDLESLLTCCFKHRCPRERRILTWCCEERVSNYFVYKTVMTAEAE